jgi:hypothetical protein
MKTPSKNEAQPPEEENAAEKSEWKYPGPNPEAVFEEQKKALEKHEKVLSKMSGNEESMTRSIIEAGISIKHLTWSNDSLMGLAKLPKFAEAVASTPHFEEDDSLEDYLDKLTPLQQEIVLNQAVQNRTANMLSNEISSARHASKIPY